MEWSTELPIEEFSPACSLYIAFNWFINQPAASAIFNAKMQNCLKMVCIPVLGIKAPILIQRWHVFSKFNTNLEFLLNCLCAQIVSWICPTGSFICRGTNLRKLLTQGKTFSPALVDRLLVATQRRCLQIQTVAMLRCLCQNHSLPSMYYPQTHQFLLMTNPRPIHM